MLETIKGNVVCPRCDGNGLVYKAKIEDLNIILYICDECEAMWQKNDPISQENFKDLSIFLEENGCNYNNITLTELGYDWYKPK